MNTYTRAGYALRDGLIVGLAFLVAIGGYLGPELRWFIAGS